MQRYHRWIFTGRIQDSVENGFWATGWGRGSPETTVRPGRSMERFEIRFFFVGLVAKGVDPRGFNLESWILVLSAAVFVCSGVALSFSFTLSLYVSFLFVHFILQHQICQVFRMKNARKTPT